MADATVVVPRESWLHLRLLTFEKVFAQMVASPFVIDAQNGLMVRDVDDDFASSRRVLAVQTKFCQLARQYISFDTNSEYYVICKMPTESDIESDTVRYNQPIVLLRV